MLSPEFEENISELKSKINKCSDIKTIGMKIGRDYINCLVAYIEVTVGGTTSNVSAVSKILNNLSYLSADQIYEVLDNNHAGLIDVKYYTEIDEALDGLLTGDVIVFVDGYCKILKIPDQGYPSLGVKETESEKVIRGSNEGFSDSIKLNTALIRRRIRTVDLKVEEMTVGVRSKTGVAVVYMQEIARPSLIQQIKQRLKKYIIDSVQDTGVLEQLAEKQWYSPFPEFQTTTRPDRAAMAVMEGRVIVLSDNSPSALILPVDINSFLRTTDDYYNRFQVASFARIIRYLAAFFACTMPGLYLAVTNFHTQILPTSLLLSFWENRIGVPFPEVVEVILMEMSFELLREAGIRLPGAMGNAIGIVGGLIIGQAAVDANIVSPIVVIVVAFTALCSFAIPNEEFAFSFRIIKFYIIVLSSWLGFFGFLLGIYSILIHLSKLMSFGIPYLMPYVGAELNDYKDERDSFLRLPFLMLNRRPFYARSQQRIKLKNK